MSGEEEEILFETAEEDIADFADQEEEETVEDTIVDQEEGEVFENIEEGTVEDSHPSELEDIIEEVNRVELRIASTVLKSSATVKSDSDSDSSAYSSDSDSDSECDSDYSYKDMKNPETGMGILLKWNGDKAT